MAQIISVIQEKGGTGNPRLLQTLQVWRQDYLTVVSTRHFRRRVLEFSQLVD